MKKTVVIVITLLLCLSLIPVSFAGNLGSMMGSVKVSKQVTGTISSIDTDAMTITLKQKVDDKEVENKYVFDRYTSIKRLRHTLRRDCLSSRRSVTTTILDTPLFEGKVT